MADAMLKVAKPSENVSARNIIPQVYWGIATAHWGKGSNFDKLRTFWCQNVCMTSPTLIAVNGLELEVLHIPRAQDSDTLSPKPSCVFLHEGLGSVALWKDWPQRVCESLDCEGWVFSRRGYGQSEGIADVRGTGRLRANYMHHEALVVLPDLLVALNIQNPLLIGHSDGGTIALIHASEHPVGGCVVMAPHVMVEDISIKAISQARDNFDKLRPRLAAFHKDVDVAFWQWNDVWLSDNFRSFDIRPLLHKIQAPLLAIQGIDDPYGTMAQIDEIAAQVPHTQRVKLSQCGHSPHKDQPEQVLQALKYFSSSLGKIQRH
jgi:pimeloyl-ACP methyl ester carboxylesterase